MLRIIFTCISGLLMLITAEISIADNNNLEQYGVRKNTSDTYNTQTDTYTKEVYKTDDHGYGVYGSSTREYNNSDGERDTNANENPNSGSKGAGIYMDF